MKMKRFGLLAIAAASLMACTPMSAGFDALASAATQAGPTANTALAVADSTVLDEKAAIAVETAYQATALAVLTATRAGLIKGETATKIDAADRKAYQAVLMVRTAYDAGNSRTYAESASNAVALIRNTISLLKGT